MLTLTTMIKVTMYLKFKIESTWTTNIRMHKRMCMDTASNKDLTVSLTQRVHTLRLERLNQLEAIFYKFSKFGCLNNYESKGRWYCYKCKWKIGTQSTSAIPRLVPFFKPQSLNGTKS